MIPLLFLLNIFDYILTLLNLNNFEEANPIANLILQSEHNILLLTILKLVIVPLLLFVLYKYHNMRLVKVATILLTLVYLYAVVMGGLYYAINNKL